MLQGQWDPTFSEHSYGFRPGRSAHQAVAQAQAFVADGYDVVVDIDLEKFFDRVNQDRLMARVAERVSDKRVLTLIRALLRAGVLEDGMVRPTEEGTPQGGPLSPLLSNLVLDELDQELERRGHRFCRYADDRVNQDRLMARVAERVSDKRVLTLIRALLRAGVLEDGMVRPTEEGTPQGGPLSPLLSNLVLDELDQELERRGHRFCRYADDCNIYVRSHRAGDRVMSSVCRFVTTQLRLKVNVSKSAVARPEERKFLGFRITNDGRQRQIAPQALDRFKMRIRELTRRKLGVSLPQLVEQLAPYLVGWRGYFGFCDAPRVLANLDAWIRRRLRMYLWRQWQSGRHRFQELRRRGVSQFHAAVAAGSPTGFWRMSRHPAVQQALRNRYFDSVGLPRLAASSNA